MYSAKLIFSILCVSLALSGCLPKNGGGGLISQLSSSKDSTSLQASLKAWEGEEISTLITVYGPPSAVIDLPKGEKVYSYSKEKEHQGSTMFSGIAGMFGAGSQTKSLINNVTNKSSISKCIVNFKTNAKGIINLATISEDGGSSFSSDCDMLIKPVPSSLASSLR